VTGIKHRHLSLNEIFAAEKEVAQTSIFSLNVNKEYIGKFKSSGLIISTGTGSTGWLYSAKRFTEINVERALNKLGAYNEPSEVYKNIAVALSEQTVFAPNQADMYYFVREPIQGKGFQHEGQGFAKQIEFLSELIDGRVNIDGMKGFDIHLGDTFNVTLDP
jgi:NAD+ kinase